MPQVMAHVDQLLQTNRKAEADAYLSDVGLHYVREVRLHRMTTNRLGHLKGVE
jgi:hypothetical protein